MTFFIAPSINSLFVTGFFLLIIFILFLNNFKQLTHMDSYKLIILLSIISIAIGIHGLLHLGAETNYGFNPFNWI